MRTVDANELSLSDLVGAIATSKNGNTVIIYYVGDVIPQLPGPTPQEVAAAEARRIKNSEDSEAARQYDKLKNLIQMSPAEVKAWVAANVTNLAQAQDAIATLAVAVSVLGRRI